MAKFTVIITSYKEHSTIGKAVRQILHPNQDLWNNMQLIIVAPDKKTLMAARAEVLQYKEFKNFLILQDKAMGKPAALNLAMKWANGEIVVFTDGDIYVDDKAIKNSLKGFKHSKVGGVSGYPTSLNLKENQFGYYSHLFCEAAHIRRSFDTFVPMSGYLYAIKNIKGLFPIPEEIRAEDAYISYKLIEKGYKISYAPNAMAYVRFPQNFKDWIAQKTRSLGGNVQLKSYINSTTTLKRSIVQDFQMFLFPIKFAKTPKEFIWSLALYPLRLYLWIKIYIQHLTNSYSKGAWERIKSTK